MTREEIIKGNKLIAEFMGFVRYFPNMTLESDLSKFYYYPYNDRIFDEGLYTSTKMTSQEGYYVNQCIRENHHLKNMQFHSSWGWLMPVVQKIATLGFKVTLEFEEKPYLNSISIQENSTGEYIEEDYEDMDYEIESDIHLVWFNVVNFIKWKLQ